jgi:phosphopantothenoylcysteine decarboxylase/phosphopantothenate--cysteine ligase
MGFSLAQEAAGRGALVTLVSGPVQLVISHPNIKLINVLTADEMHHACMQEAPEAEIVIMTAAVADYSCSAQSAEKIKKCTKPFHLELVPTKDILKEIGAHKQSDQILVGFALETDHELEHAKAKLISKNLDYIVMNSLKDEGAGFGLKTNKITIIGRSGPVYQSQLNDKRVIAAEIIDYIVKNTTFNHEKS